MRVYLCDTCVTRTRLVGNGAKWVERKEANEYCGAHPDFKSPAERCRRCSKARSCGTQMITVRNYVSCMSSDRSKERSGLMVTTISSCKVDKTLHPSKKRALGRVSDALESLLHVALEGDRLSKPINT